MLSYPYCKYANRNIKTLRDCDDCGVAQDIAYCCGMINTINKLKNNKAVDPSLVVDEHPGGYAEPIIDGCELKYIDWNEENEQ